MIQNHKCLFEKLDFKQIKKKKKKVTDQDFSSIFNFGSY